MTAISFAPTTVTPTVAPDYAASSDGQHMTAAGAFRVTTVSPGWSSSAPTTGADSDALDGNLTHLDEPYPVMVMATGNSTTTTRTISLRAGQQVIGVASVSRQLPPGPPMRGFYRIHGAAVRDGSCGHGGGYEVIEQCIRYAAAHEGRVLWCHASVAMLQVWRRYSFTVAGWPVAVQGGGAGVFMTRRLTPADAGLSGIVPHR